MKKTMLTTLLTLAIVVAGVAQQSQSADGTSASGVSLQGLTPNLRNGFQFSLRGGYDILPMYPETPMASEYNRVITAVRGGLMGGISADYYWNWIGLGADADYILNGMRPIEETDFYNLSRFFYGAGPNFRYLDPSNTYSLELNTRAGLGIIKTSEELAKRVLYDSKNIFSLKGQLRFTYFLNPIFGIHAGGYYMHHFNASFSENIYNYDGTSGYADAEKINIASVGAFAGITLRIPSPPAVPKPPKKKPEKTIEDQVINGVVVVCDTKQPFDGVSIVVKEKKGGKERILTSNKAGEFSFVVTPSSTITIYGKKANYFSQVVTLGPKDLKLYQNVQLEICMERADCDESVRLNNIHYDLDKYDIRPDARPELDRLVQFLRDNPEVKVELSSHTDSRASHEYNQRLSQNRANSAREYVISRGIDPSRIISVGYGETRLLNRCADGVPCSEEEHQQNRRTEMKVICPK